VFGSTATKIDFGRLILVTEFQVNITLSVKISFDKISFNQEPPNTPK